MKLAIFYKIHWNYTLFIYIILFSFLQYFKHPYKLLPILFKLFITIPRKVCFKLNETFFLQNLFFENILETGKLFFIRFAFEFKI